MIGDGATVGRMAHEGLKHAGSLGSRLIEIQTRNDTSNVPSVGAISAYLSKLISSKGCRILRDTVHNLAVRSPRAVELAMKCAEECSIDC